MPRLKLHWWILIGMFAGAAWGAALNAAYFADFEQQSYEEVLGKASWSDAEAAGVTKPVQKAVTARMKGTLFGGMAYGLAALFMALLKMVVIPLVFCSLIVGVAGMRDFKRLGKIGGKAAAWYMTTSLLAIITGLVLVNVIGPGRGLELPIPIGGAPTAVAATSAWDMLVAMVPSNLFRSMANFQLLSVIVFALLFGGFLLKVSEERRTPVLTFFEGAFDVMMQMTLFVISLAPVGIAALIAKLVSSTGAGVFLDLAGYFGTVAAALAVHFFGTLPLLFWLVTRKNPYRVMRLMSPALLTAFSTASSSGTLPMTIKRLEKNVGVSNKISSFVLPLGATVNMDGTALYECVATLFIAQVYAGLNPEFSMTFSTQLTIVALALVVSIGAAGIPHAGLVMMVIIFEAVGLPLELTALLWAVDRPLDMCRTAVNVWSDSMGSTAIAYSEGEITEPAPA